MEWFSFWIREAADINKKSGMNSAKKINIEAYDYYEALVLFANEYGSSCEICINGLTNGNKIIDLQGKTLTITCLAIRIINQVTIRNGTLIIVPVYDSVIQRSNLEKVIIGLRSRNNARLVISHTNCQGTFFIGNNIFFNGPVYGEYVSLDNNKKKRELSEIQISAEDREIKQSISPEKYNQIATELGTKNVGKIIEAYNKLKPDD